MGAIDTTNMAGVSVSGDEIVLLINRPRMTKEQAINMAAWLIVLSGAWHDDEATERFSALVSAIEES